MNALNPSKRIVRALSDRARTLLPNFKVRRTVQGVTLTLPWSHRLPDYARAYPGYGQNLVRVAKIVAETSKPTRFAVLDIGANVGDSALQILNAIDADVVCLDGDEHWIPFLLRNVSAEPRIRIVHAMLVPSSAEFSAAFTPLRSNGTTRFIPGRGGKTAPSKTADSLRDELLEDNALAPVRLIKCDTDGFDVRLMPGLARAFAATRPVLFFEFDPAMTRASGDPDPERVWPQLIDLGYNQCIVWDNYGNWIGCWQTSELSGMAAVLEASVANRSYHYWDVAAVHADDPSLTAIVGALNT